MALWMVNDKGEPERAIPSTYVFQDMDSDEAKAVLGRLLDLLWETGKLSDAEIVEIVGGNKLSVQPRSKKGSTPPSS